MILGLSRGLTVNPNTFNLPNSPVLIGVEWREKLDLFDRGVRLLLSSKNLSFVTFGES